LPLTPLLSTTTRTHTTYLLQLQHNCFYVGVTTRTPDTRYAEHLSRNTAAARWTKLHKVVRLLHLYHGDVERLVMIHACNHYRAEYVRGDSWCVINTAQHFASIRSILNTFPLPPLPPPYATLPHSNLITNYIWTDAALPVPNLLPQPPPLHTVPPPPSLTPTLALPTNSNNSNENSHNNNSNSSNSIVQ